MSTELVGFENLPNAFIKDVSIFKESARQNLLEITIRVHDLPDRSVWSSTEEIFFQLMRVGVVISMDSSEIESLTNGSLAPTSVKYMSKSLAISPQVTEENSYFELKFIKSVPGNPTNITAFAFCFISKEDIASSIGVMIADHYVGPVKSENIFINGDIARTTDVFLRSDGSYWPGPVHQRNGNFMEGSYHTNSPHNRLTKLTITNTKVKDKRDRIETKRSQAHTIKNIMSELFVSYSSKTDVNLMFMMNIKSLLVKHTKYGAFLNRTSEDVMKIILRNLKFQMISVQRQRIKSKFRSYGLKSRKRKTDMVFSKKNILNTQDDNNRKLLDKTRYERNGSYDLMPGELENLSDYKKIADMQEMFFNYGSEIRTFQITDYELTHKTPGDYQYKIQFQFADPVDRFLRNVLAIMKSDISSLTDYLSIFKRRRSTSIDASVIVKNYLDYYSYIYDFNQKEKVSMSLKMISLLNPSTTDTSSISSFLKKYKNLYNDFLTFVEYDDQKTMNNPFSLKAKDNMSSRIIVNKLFDQIVTPSDNSFSYSYLPESDNKKTAMFSKTSFFETVQQQIEDEFVEQPNFSSTGILANIASAVSDIQTTKTAFLSPNFFLSGQKKGVMANTLEAIKSLNDSRMSDISQKMNMPQVVSNKTTPFNPIFLRIESVADPSQETEQEKYIDADEILGNNSHFSFYNETDADFNKPSIKSETQKKFENAILQKNNRTVNGTLEALKKISELEAKELPNQLKAVINGQTKATRSNFISNGNDLLAHPTTKAYYDAKNFSVKEVVYVDGFMKDKEGNTLLNKPVYKTLMLDKFEKLSKPVLCFLKDYSNEKFNISASEKTQAINSVFILSDEDISSPRDTQVLESDPIYTTQDIQYQFMNSNIVQQTNTPVTLTINSNPQNVESVESVSSLQNIASTNNTTFGGY